MAQATAEAYAKQPAPVANALGDAITAANNNGTQVRRLVRAQRIKCVNADQDVDRRRLQYQHLLLLV